LGEGGFNNSGKALEKLLSENEDIKRMIRELLSKGFTTGEGGISMGPKYDFGGSGKFRPPVPNVGFEGEITQGYSYKFGQNLPVVDKNGRDGLDDPNKYDFACLQL